MTSLTTFITIAIALSVAAERVVEIVKGLLPNFWLFQSGATPTSEYRRVALIHCFSGICGGAAAALSKIDLLTYLQSPSIGSTAPPAPEGLLHATGAFVIAGLLTSAGSAFWNHVFDIVKATKVQQESAAIIAAGTKPVPPAPGGTTTSMTLA
jgi:hypothetical protein